MKHTEIAGFLWGVADLIRDTFRRGHYQDVILPLTVLRRVDCVLQGSKEEVLKKNAEYREKLDNPRDLLRSASGGYVFYNTSRYDFEKLRQDAPNLATNLRNYIAGFSDNMREVFEKFDFDNTISKLDESGLLFLVLERFKAVELHPDVVDNHMMGMIFEELIRKFNEAMNENPGEHFTPRDVVHLMVRLMFAGDDERLRQEGFAPMIYDPCCGSGGMLTIAKEHLVGDEDGTGLNPNGTVHLFGQEVNPQTWALSCADLIIKHPKRNGPDRIAYGSTLSNDGHAGIRFDYLIANPPYGKDWKRDKAAVEAEAERGDAGRFGAGTPRISDGQLLFLQHMAYHMKPVEEGGSRIALIMNGSPLFTGDAGSGESEIRRWVLENDMLEALVALPEQLFYNTGIATYVWVLTNRKAPERRGKVQLVDATSFWVPMKKSLGDKRREIPKEKMVEILEILGDFREGERSHIFPTTHFGFRKITVERPLRLNFRSTPDRIARLDEEAAFRNLAVSKKRDPAAKAEAEAAGRTQQETIRVLLRTLPDDVITDREAFRELLRAAAKRAEVKLPAPLIKAIESALSERDPNADICRSKDGSPEPDPQLRDTESVPLSETVQAFFDREVRPHVPDAWIDERRRDTKDGEVGIVGYEINFNRYFYVYEPPRPLSEIQSDLRAVEADIVQLLGEISA